MEHTKSQEANKRLIEVLLERRFLMLDWVLTFSVDEETRDIVLKTS